MPVHPLKFLALFSVLALIGCQLGLLFWLHNEYRLIIAGLLILPLLFPLKGMFSDHLYTFKWTGFVALLYLCIGISESFTNSGLRIYSILTTLFSCLLFISSIYYSRYLRFTRVNS